MHQLTANDCRFIASFAKSSTLEEALSILNRWDLNGLYATVYPSKGGKKRFKDFGEKSSDLYRLLDYLDLVWFAGGPPYGTTEGPVFGWYEGTLCTYFADRLFRLAIYKGMDFMTELIHDYVMRGTP